MTDKELMQQALDALDLVTDLTTHDDVLYEAIDALRERLAQPEPEELGEIIPADEEQLKRIAKLVEPEPVAWMYNSVGDTRFAKTLDTPGMHKDESVPLYTAPPQREWQGLTDEDLIWCEDHSHGNTTHAKMKAYGRAIEAKLREKNSD